MKLTKHLVFAAAAILSTSYATAQTTGQTSGEPVKIRGFVDAQYKWQKSQDNTTGAVINDGALYFTHKTGDTELFVDLPFAYSNQGVTYDANGVAQTNNSFLVGGTKPQAFISHTMGSTKLQLGQFDTIFGLELNDSPDIVFSTQGILFANMIPLTHTGAVVSHAFGPVTVKAVAANSVTGKGDAGAQLKGKGEYGATVGYTDQMFRASVGYLTGRIVSTNATLQDKSRNFTDLVVGGTFGSFLIDVEYAMEKFADRDQGTGLAVIPVFNINEQFSAAARYEMLKDVSVGGSIFGTATQITAGVQYLMSEALRLKVDYSVLNLKSPDRDDDNSFAFAAIYKF